MKIRIIIFLFINLQACQKGNIRRAVRKDVENMGYEWHKNRVSFERKQMKNYVKRDSLYEYQISELGFFYAHKNKKNKGPVPKKGDVVFFEYQIENINRDLIYDANKLGIKKYFVDKSHIIKGLRAGIKLMKKNDEVRFVFPSHMAYGVSGDGDKIGMNQIIVVDVKLIKVNNLTK